MIKINNFFKFGLNYRDMNIIVVSFVACAFIFALRNLDPLLFPTLYAEDGVWMGLLMQNGFIDTVFHAREGFPVLGLVALNWIALKLNLLFSNGIIFTLPFYIWIISIAFLSAVSVLPAIAFRNFLPLRYRLSLVFILPLMPTGASGNEIFGRIGNLVFLFPLICIYSICLFRSSAGSTIAFVVSLFIIFICALTFPVCLAILMFWLVFEIFLSLSSKFKIFNYYFEGLEPLSLIRIAAFVLVFLSCFYLMPDNLLSFKGAADMPTKAAGWVDYVGARLVLYPLISSYYSAMNNISTILGCIIVSILMVYGMIIKNNGKMRFAIILLSASFILYFASTAIMRSGFTSVFGHYANSYPDRYFLGINVLFLIALCFAIYQLPHFRGLAFASVLIFYFINTVVLYKHVFEGGVPAMHWRQFDDLRHMTCLSAVKGVPVSPTYKDNLVMFPIYPKMGDNQFLRMTVPKSVFLRSIESGCYAAIAEKYDGKIVHQPAANRGKADGWYLVKNGERSWITDGAWLDRNGYKESEVIEISSLEFNAITEGSHPLD